MKKQESIDKILARIAIFSALNEEQMVLVKKNMRFIRLDIGENLFDDQMPADRFFLLHKGQVKLSRLSSNGAEKVVEIIQPGQLFALAVMFMEQEKFPVCADAVRPCEVYSFDCKTFLDLLRSSVDTCFRVMADLSFRLRRQMGEIDNLCLQSASFRLVQYLLEQCSTSGSDSTEVILNAPKNLIASRLSIQPETFSRILRNLSRRNLIKVDNKIVSIPSISSLEAFVESGELCRAKEK